MPSAPYVYGASIVVAAYIAGVLVVNSVQPEPYMDEVFHAPQTARYCAGDLMSYNSNITTLPGLYAFGVAFTYALSLLWAGGADIGVALHILCSDVRVLRMLSPVLGGCMFAIACLALLQLHPRMSDTRVALRGVTVSLFPLLFGTSMLYYTDMGSAVFVLGSYYLSLTGNRAWSALVGAVAILFRQTNIVWLLYISSCAVLNAIEPIVAKQLEDARLRSKAIGDPGQHREKEKGIDVDRLFFVDLRLSVACCWVNRAPILHAMWSYVLVFAMFAGFVVVNGGIVLGHQQFHTTTLHLAQLLYFSAVLALGDDPVGVVCRLWSHVTDPQVFLLGLYAACAAAVQYFTVAHPFLLADNRHYVFYLWRRVLSGDGGTSGWIFLVPLYAAALHSVWRKAGRAKATIKPLHRVLLAACTAIALVPSPLLELRYFIVPFIIYSIETADADAELVGCLDAMPALGMVMPAMLAVVYAAADALYVYVFACRPITGGEGGRFIW